MHLKKTHPHLAEYALKGTLIVAKGVVGAGSGLIVAGPPGAVTGGISGITQGVVGEVRGAMINHVAGEQIEAIINRGVDTLVPRFLSLDHSLNEQEARILASVAIGSTTQCS